MATQTENLGLRKPAPEDLVNVTTDISDNMDLLDAAIDGKAESEHSHGGGEVAGAVEAHRTDTTDVHGISNTANLSLVGHNHSGVYAPAADVATHSADTTDVHGIPDTSLLVDNADLVAHNEDTTAVHGIANTALLITTADHALIDHDDIPGAGQIPVQDEAPVGPDLHDLWVDSDEPAISGGGGSSIAYQPDAPDNPAEGDLWADSDETVPAGSSVEVNLVRVAVTPTISTTIYAAGDAVGGLMTFATAAGSGKLVAVTIVDKDQERADLDLVLFDRTVTAPTDNAAFDPTDAELAFCLGWVPIGAGMYSNLTDNAVAHLDLALSYVLNGTDIFGVLVARSAPTYTATTDIVVTLTVETY